MGYFGFRRFNTVADIPNRLFKAHKTLHGRVIIANDSDGLRIEHLPPVTRFLKLDPWLDRSLPCTYQSPPRPSLGIFKKFFPYPPLVVVLFK